jgi:hypothetical protein
MSVWTTASTAPTTIVRIAMTHSIGCQVQRSEPKAT